ncbi:hypothetical protein COSO111634_21225 [Corallococcus soli]
MDQPSETMWCMLSTTTCSCSSSFNSVARSSGPRSRSKGRWASSEISRRASASRAEAGSAVRSITGSRKSVVAAMTWNDVSASVRNVVRRGSWRRISSWKTRSNTFASTVPMSRTATGRL